MKTIACKAITLIACFLTGLSSTNAHSAEQYPAKAIRLVVPFAPGGGSDRLARLIGPFMTEKIGQQVIVDNRAGGNTIIGVGLVASALPDGYTLLLGNANFTINAALYSKLPYDPIKDFTAVSALANVSNVLVVNSTVPAKSLQELIVLIRSKPGQLNFASPGAGTSSAMSGVLLQSMAKLDFVVVPYKGAGPSMVDLVGGHVSMGVAAMSSVLPHVKTGKLRALGVTTAKRSVLMPELPTIAESGVPGYDVSNWFGVMSGKGVSPAIVRTLETTLGKIVQEPETQKQMAAQGTEPFVLSSVQFEKFIAAETAKWTKLGNAYKLHIE